MPETDGEDASVGSTIASAHSVGARSARIARAVAANSGFADSMAKSIALRFRASSVASAVERLVGAGFTAVGFAKTAQLAGAGPIPFVFDAFNHGAVETSFDATVGPAAAASRGPSGSAQTS